MSLPTLQTELRAHGRLHAMLAEPPCGLVAHGYSGAAAWVLEQSTVADEIFILGTSDQGCSLLNLSSVRFKLLPFIDGVAILFCV